MARSVDLPPELYDRVETRVAGTEFDSPDEYVGYVLRAVLDEVTGEVEAPETVDEATVRDRLESLGYLDP